VNKREIGLKGIGPREVEKVKLEDVARNANVSPATVSRVLNHPELVRPEVRDKVAQSIAKLSYTRDSAGRALKSGRTFTVGAIVPTLGASIFAAGVEALQNRLSEHGYTLLVANSQYDSKKELTEAQSLLERGVDGLVLVGDDHMPKLPKLLRQQGIPVVTTYVSKTKSGIPAIGIDNASATYELTRYMLGLGHRVFGVIANLPASNDRSLARHAGIMRALDEAGVTLVDSQIIGAFHPVAHGRKALRTLMRQYPSITAVMCTADTLAIGALAEAKAMGLKVPEELSVTGFDDIEITSEFDPPLTTVSIPAVEIGRFAADHLLDAFAGISRQEAAMLPYRLVIRGSTGVPPRTRPAAR
jgi:LacI family transcriptional regulator, galactose operon repressor